MNNASTKLYRLTVDAITAEKELVSFHEQWDGNRCKPQLEHSQEGVFILKASERNTSDAEIGFSDAGSGCEIRITTNVDKRKTGGNGNAFIDEFVARLKEQNYLEGEIVQPVIETVLAGFVAASWKKVHGVIDDYRLRNMGDLSNLGEMRLLHILLYDYCLTFSDEFDAFCWFNLEDSGETTRVELRTRDLNESPALANWTRLLVAYLQSMYPDLHPHTGQQLTADRKKLASELPKKKATVERYTAMWVLICKMKEDYKSDFVGRDTDEPKPTNEDIRDSLRAEGHKAGIRTIQRIKMFGHAGLLDTD